MRVIYFQKITHQDSPLRIPKIEREIFDYGLDIAGPSSRKTFKCNFCLREFSCPQALGGHQNGHKQERAIAKQRQARIIPDNHFGVLGHSYSPQFNYYSTKPQLNYDPLGYNRASGFELEPMTYSPFYNPHQTVHIDRLIGKSLGTSRVSRIGNMTPITYQLFPPPSASTGATTTGERNKSITVIDLTNDDNTPDASGLDLTLRL